MTKSIAPLCTALVFFFLSFPLSAQITFEKVYVQESGFASNARFHPGGGYAFQICKADSVFDLNDQYLAQICTDDIVRTDDWGNILWRWSDETRRHPYKIMEVMANGDLLVVGNLYVTAPKDQIQVWRLDSLGQVIWSNHYSSPGFYYEPTTIAEFANGDIAVTFAARDGNGVFDDRYSGSLRIESNGQLKHLVEFNHELGNLFRPAFHGVPYQGDKLVRAGYLPGDSMYLSITDSAGVPLQQFPLESSSFAQYAQSRPVILDDGSIAFLYSEDPPATFASTVAYMRVDTNGQLLADTLLNYNAFNGQSGNSLVHRNGEVFTVQNAIGGSIDEWIIMLQKLSADGIEQWTGIFWGIGSAYLYRFNQTLDVLPNGDLLFAGYTSTPSGNVYRPYLVRTDLNGFVNTEAPQKSIAIELGPNPSTGKFRVDWAVEESLAPDYTLVDTKGRILQHGQLSRNQELDISNLPNGLYQVQLTFEDGRRGSQKLLLAR